MKTSPRISVIVPVYNAEKWLYRCIDSILAQTFEDFELLLIDDGSTDRSGAICDEYAIVDSRVRVFHKPNGGVSSARRLGIEEAKGEYSIHVDSDDYIDKAMLYDMLTAIKDYDLLVSGYYVRNGNDEILINQYNEITDNKEIAKKCLNHELLGSLCNKLIRHSLYSSSFLDYIKDIDYCEDFLIVIQMLNIGVKVGFMRGAYYHYVQNAGSLTHRTTQETALSIFNMLFKLENIEIIKTNCREEYYLMASEFIGRIYAESDLSISCLCEAPHIPTYLVLSAIFKNPVHRRLRFFVLLKNIFSIRIARKIILKIKNK